MRMDTMFEACDGLREDIRKLRHWRKELRFRKRFVRRGVGKSLQVQALVNSALIEIDDQLRLKMSEARRIETEIRSAMSTISMLNLPHKKPCKDVNGWNRFMCLMKKKISHLLLSFRCLFPVILFAYFFHSRLSI
jgi:hypothetical protein